MRIRCLFLMLFFSAALQTHGQSTVQPAQTPRVTRPVNIPQEDFIPNRPSNTPTSLQGNEYRIGPDDLIEVSVFEAPELSASGRVSASGVISVPLLGAIKAAGSTPQEVGRTIEAALKKNIINDPHVTVFVREYASQPVSIIGAVRVPGIYQMKGQKALLDMLAMAQGLDQSMAGNIIQVMRRGDDKEVEPKTIIVSTEDLFQNGKTELNIPIEPGDVINVLQAGSVFVIGEVMRSGEFVLRQGKNITVGQAVAQGGGFSREAKKQQCLIIRLHRDGTKEEIPVNAGKILEGTVKDVEMMPNDILFVPANKVKTGLLKALDTTIATLSARAVYRF